MECSFNKSNCSPKCEKYPLCSFFEIEHQIGEISQQLNLLFKTVNSLSSVTISNKDSIEELNDNLNTYTKDMLDLISYTKNKEK